MKTFRPYVFKPYNAIFLRTDICVNTYMCMYICDNIIKYAGGGYSMVEKEGEKIQERYGTLSLSSVCNVISKKKDLKQISCNINLCF